MKLSKEDEAICKKYSALDKTGRVHCSQCPLVRPSRLSDCTCLANSCYDERRETWVPDSWEQEDVDLMLAIGARLDFGR